jgi:hypothetical protein
MSDTELPKIPKISEIPSIPSSAAAPAVDPEPRASVDPEPASSNGIDGGGHGFASTEQAKEAQRRNLTLLIGFVLFAFVLGGAYVVFARSRVTDNLADRQERALEAVAEFEATREATPEPAATEPPVDTAAAVPPAVTAKSGEVMFVNRVPGDDYGRLGIRHADGSRTLLNRDCVRVHIAADHGVCLSDDGLGAFQTTFFEAANPAVSIKSYSSALPSRARISPGGTFSSVTAFITGVSYADVGAETTTLVTIDKIDSNDRLRGANGLAVDASEERYQRFDATYWGLSFVDENEFYITGFYGDAPEIMRGTIDSMTIEPTGWIGSCPSISPDGQTLVFKEQRPDGGYDLAAVNVATQEKWLLGESRSVDDQVEWLDNDTILYALHPEGSDDNVQPEFDIWMLDIAPGSTPELFLPNADSPAAAR